MPSSEIINANKFWLRKKKFDEEVYSSELLARLISTWASHLIWMNVMCLYFISRLQFTFHNVFHSPWYNSYITFQNKWTWNSHQNYIDLPHHRFVLISFELIRGVINFPEHSHCTIHLGHFQSYSIFHSKMKFGVKYAPILLHFLPE